MNLEQEKISNQTIIIGRNNDFYIVTNTPNTTLSDYLNYGAIVDSNGKQITGFLPIGTLLRDEPNWELMNTPYNQIIKEVKVTSEDALLGFAVGDAFGVPMEFLPRETVRKLGVTEMTGNDVFPQLNSRWGKLIPSGSWSDDTSMLISSMDSITRCNGINYEDIMKSFMSWYNGEKYTSLDFTFGVGSTVLKALKKYIMGVPPLSCGGINIRDNGNGSLMRILPFSLYCINNRLSDREMAEVISAASGLTHAHDISKMSCYIYTQFLKSIIETKNPVLAFDKLHNIDYSQYFSAEAIQAHQQLLKGSFKFITYDKIKESGYVVDTLESVIYSILHSRDFESSILTAVNMGYDTDTVAGITGSIAGILYGKESIPNRWLEKLKKKEYLEKIAQEFDRGLELNKNENVRYNLN